MNKRNIITVAVCLVAVCLVLVVKCHPRTLPIEECSQVYKDYADDPHVAVAFIKDFPVNDTLRVDVTTLRALDSTGWETLEKDFNILDMPDDVLELMKTQKKAVAIRVTSKNNIGSDMDNDNIDENYVLAIDYIKHTVGIFYTENKEEIKSVMRYNLDQNTKKHEQKN